MAEPKVANGLAHPNDRHLVMSTRRQFGQELRREIRLREKDIDIQMNFSEDLLETWAFSGQRSSYSFAY